MNEILQRSVLLRKVGAAGLDMARDLLGVGYNEGLHSFDRCIEKIHQYPDAIHNLEFQKYGLDETVCTEGRYIAVMLYCRGEKRIPYDDALKPNSPSLTKMEQLCPSERMRTTQSTAVDRAYVEHTRLGCGDKIVLLGERMAKITRVAWPTQILSVQQISTTHRQYPLP